MTLREKSEPTYNYLTSQEAFLAGMPPRPTDGGNVSLQLARQKASIQNHTDININENYGNKNIIVQDKQFNGYTTDYIGNRLFLHNVSKETQLVEICSNLDSDRLQVIEYQKGTLTAKYFNGYPYYIICEDSSAKIPVRIVTATQQYNLPNDRHTNGNVARGNISITGANKAYEVVKLTSLLQNGITCNRYCIYNKSTGDLVHDVLLPDEITPNLMHQKIYNFLDHATGPVTKTSYRTTGNPERIVFNKTDDKELEPIFSKEAIDLSAQMKNVVGETYTINNVFSLRNQNYSLVVTSEKGKFLITQQNDVDQKITAQIHSDTSKTFCSVAEDASGNIAYLEGEVNQYGFLKEEVHVVYENKKYQINASDIFHTFKNPELIFRDNHLSLKGKTAKDGPTIIYDLQLPKQSGAINQQVDIDKTPQTANHLTKKLQEEGPEETDEFNYKNMRKRIENLSGLLQRKITYGKKYIFFTDKKKINIAGKLGDIELSGISLTLNELIQNRLHDAQSEFNIDNSLRDAAVHINTLANMFVDSQNKASSLNSFDFDKALYKAILHFIQQVITFQNTFNKNSYEKDDKDYSDETASLLIQYTRFVVLLQQREKSNLLHPETS